MYFDTHTCCINSLSLKTEDAAFQLAIPGCADAHVERDVFIWNTVDDPFVVLVQVFDKLFGCIRLQDGEHHIEFGDDDQHRMLIIRREKWIAKRQVFDRDTRETQQLTVFERLDLEAGRCLSDVADFGKERILIVGRETGDAFLPLVCHEDIDEKPFVDEIGVLADFAGAEQ